MGYNVAGSVGNAYPLITNKVPYIDIEYSIPHIPVNYSEIDCYKTISDVISVGINFFDIITEISTKPIYEEKINADEVNELLSILKGGVIFNGNTG